MCNQFRSAALVIAFTVSSCLVFADDAANGDRNDGQNAVAIGTVVPVLRLEMGDPVVFECDFVNRTDEVFRYGGSREYGIQNFFFVPYHNAQPLHRVVFFSQLFVEGQLNPRARLPHDVDVERLYERVKRGRYELHAIYNTPPGNAFSLTPLNIDKPLLQFVIE